MNLCVQYEGWIIKELARYLKQQVTHQLIYMDKELQYSPAFSVLCGCLLSSWPGKQGHSPSHFIEIVFPDRQLWNSILHCKRKKSQKTGVIEALLHRLEDWELQGSQYKFSVLESFASKIIESLWWVWRCSLKSKKTTQMRSSGLSRLGLGDFKFMEKNRAYIKLY